MRHAVFKAAVAGLLVAAFAGAPARAAEPTFPANSRLGLTPPPGFVPSTKFPGFENPQANAAILLIDLPAEAYAEVEKGFTDEALKSRGLAVEFREPIEIKDGRGFVVGGPQTNTNPKRREIVLAATLAGATALVSVQISDEGRATISDDAVRDALKTLTLRASVPDAEKIAVLPYRLTELSGFRVVRGGQDGSALLTDGPEDAVAAVAQPFVLIGLAGGEMPKPDERAAFARRVFSSAPGIKDIRILRAEPIRLNGQPGFEVLAEAKDMKSDTEITTVQWLRFGNSGYLQIFAIARRDAWADLFPRLRAIRDGIDAR